MKSQIRFFLLLSAVLGCFLFAEASATASCVDSKAGQIAQNQYVLLNNVFNDSGVSGWSQKICSDGNKSNAWTSTWNWPTTTNNVKSFPDINLGWRFGGEYTPNSGFPVLISAAHTLPTSVRFEVTGANTYDAAYDLFFASRNCRAQGKNPSDPCYYPTAEMMVWLSSGNSDGTKRVPAGTKIAASVPLGNIDGTWDLYKGIGGAGGTGSDSWTLYTFVKTVKTNNFSGNLRSFLYFLSYANSYLPDDDYELGISFGVEVRSNTGSNGGVAVKSFSASLD